MSLQKRSLTIAGHSTSLALEPEFWAALDAAAARRASSVPVLVAEIDSGRDPDQGLASAIRVWLLNDAQSR